MRGAASHDRYTPRPSQAARSWARAADAETPSGSRTLTARGGAEAASGPDCQTAQAEPGLTRADQPSEAAQTANAWARAGELAGRNRQAGEGRCPALGARQAQTEPRA